MGKFAYFLKLLDHWKIYPVFNITQLEFCPDPKSDPYQRERSEKSSSVFVENDIEDFKSYEFDRLLNKRVIVKGRGFVTEYLIKWKGYDVHHDK